MPAPFIVPFNFCPDSVSVKTSSYTIPAGKFARLVVNLIGTSTFTIGGVTALQGTSTTVINSSANLYRASGTPTTLSASVPPGTGLVNNASPSNAGVTTVAAVFGNSTEEKVITIDIWVPTGTVISGTGTFRITVQEYSMIS